MIKEYVKYRIASWIPEFLISGRLMQSGMIIPYYHVVSDDKVSHVKHLYDYKNIKQFNEDIEYLLKRFSPISLIDLLAKIKHGTILPQKALLLTFDDGFREISDIIAPILLRKGISATFFLNSAFVDNKTLGYQHKASLLVEHILKSVSVNQERIIKEMLLTNNVECTNIQTGILDIKYFQKDLLDKIALLIDVDFEEYLSKNKPYLTSDQILKLMSDGFTIGAHSIDHPLYSLLPLKDQVSQSKESMRYIREKYDLNYGAFAFPHSDKGVTKEYFRQMQKSGLVDISFGTGGMVKDAIPNHFQRFSLERPVMPAKKIIVYQYVRNIVRKVRGDIEIVRE